MILLSLDDYEKAAAEKLPKDQYEHYRSGAFDELTLRENKLAYDSIRIIPRVLRDVLPVDLSCKILGIDFKMPIGISPTAFQKMANRDAEGEISNARAAGKFGIPYTLSIGANTSIEDLGKQVPETIKWQQINIMRDPKLTEKLVKNAENAGFKGIVLTVDLPVLGIRRIDAANNFSYPSDLHCENLLEEIKELLEQDTEHGVHSLFDQLHKPNASWDDVKWLKSITALPVILKGILSPDDAVLAIENGADGIIVSNHGSRHMITLPTIEALPGIVKAVNGRIPVLIDGGIRQGTDVFKALALGANMVLIGRPALWGLAVDGEKGVEDILNILKKELSVAMIFAGYKRISDISKNAVIHKSQLQNF